MLKRVRRFLSRWLVGAVPEPPLLPEIALRPIGVVRSSIKETGDWRDWSEVTCRIVIRPELADALLGLDGYSHILVLFWPHLVPDDVRGSKHRLHPLDDPANPLQGVLATRSQIRFNPILVSVAPLLSVKGNVLRVRGLDAIDGTPVLDVKPYIPYYEAVPEARVPGWVMERAAQMRSGD
ncbi:MAG: tRNA (N6-threonylcarbamoyladenosine(37)-N6)-methyltransferase TrmO [Chloroflexi bacterium]|nr:tRNA (N6-threonylcarbamoyladenosine(37)-N6)-methyltransferase TrmO [Chloroflexota bacterium]